MSDSQVLTVAIVGQWRVGVPWQSERGMLRYLHAHGKDWFPYLLQRSAFNRRVRHLWGVLVRLQQVVAEALQTPQDAYETVDSIPLPAGSLGQYSRERGHWLWDSTIGRGVNGDWFWGDHLLLAVGQHGSITGWLVAAAHFNDRWLLEAFLSARSGSMRLLGAPHRPKNGYARQAKPPVGFLGNPTPVGHPPAVPYLADRGFNGERWATHWCQHFGATVLSVPPDNAQTQRPWTPTEKRWLTHHRQMVETVFSCLVQVFGLKHLQAHSRWGQYARLAAKTAAFNIGLYINRSLGRPLLALATLIC